MASFIGTKQDFKRYIGPFLRNLVQQITRKYKNEIGRCQHCGSIDQLESAHIHGRGRGTIIDNILSNYTTNDTITLNLTEFEKQFKNEHTIIDETIIILCKTCHGKYDANALIEEGEKKGKRPNFSSPPSPVTNNKSSSSRSFNNTQIQQKITAVARNLSNFELENLCKKQYSKELFNIDFPLFVRVPTITSSKSKTEAVKDESGRNRWTWKYEFIKDKFIYAVSTQWYPRHDKHVKNWLNKHEK